MSFKAMNAYKKDSLKQQLSSADPHKITLLLMNGTLERIAYAKGAIERKDYPAKSEFISKATAIIINLRDTIDQEVNPEFSDNLIALYNYMLERLSTANVKNDSSILDEVSQLMLPIKDAWASIPREDIEAAYNMPKTAVSGS